MPILAWCRWRIPEAIICGEVELRVHQCLHSQNGRLEDVKRVYAHAQSLQQCKTFVQRPLPLRGHSIGQARYFDRSLSRVMPYV